jgi:hypothetical protein
MVVAIKDVSVPRTDGNEYRIGVGDLRTGDLFVVRPGERIAADGQIESGKGTIGLQVRQDAAYGSAAALATAHHQYGRPCGDQRHEGRP